MVFTYLTGDLMTASDWYSEFSFFTYALPVHISWKLIFLIPWHTNWLLSFNIESVQSALRTDLQYLYTTSLMKTCPTGDRRWMHLGKLLATLLLPGSLGREQAQWLWSRAWRRVSNTDWELFSADVMRSTDTWIFFFTTGVLITTWPSSKSRSTPLMSRGDGTSPPPSCKLAQENFHLFR